MYVLVIVQFIIYYYYLLYVLVVGITTKGEVKRESRRKRKNKE